MSSQSHRDASESGGSLSLVDTDIHQSWKDEDELVAYLPDHWQDRGIDVPESHWHQPVGYLRDDAHPPNGGLPGSDPEYLIEQHMDEFGVDYGVLTGPIPSLVLGATANFDYATALASAVNDWLVEKWLSVDDRFLGSILIANQQPQRAAAEIRRLGDHPQMNQVLMSSATRRPYGQRIFWPIYEAAEEMGLPVMIHAAAAGRGFTNPPTGAGFPNTYFERHTVLPGNILGHLVSMVTRGIFEEYPDLKVVLCEGGFGWVPSILWRMDKNWKGLKTQTPWLTKPPSEYVREHVRFTTQPIEEPEKDEHLLQIMEMMHAEETLMFSSDYPHWDGDSPTHGLPRLPDQLAERVYHKNAQELYGL
jgi:predicted TIM-barrel fold metal-dependent hydrolase